MSAHATPDLSVITAGLAQDEAIAAVAGLLRAAGLPTARLDAKFLQAAALAQASTAGVLPAAATTDEAMAGWLRRAVSRRLGGEPVDRIIGNSEFWSRRFDLNGDTLIPRADTETVIEAALAALARVGVSRPRLLDLGTGSGAILVTLLVECPDAVGTGVDLSPGALAMAAHNSRLNDVAVRATFLAGRWTEGVTGSFDLIVSNPPYIPSGDIAGLQREVREHDPRLALDGGRDGLDAYRAIARDLPRLLAKNGRVILEIGAGQEADVEAILLRHGLALEEARRDLGGHIRALCFRRA